jgi:hypothetical protein
MAIFTPPPQGNRIWLWEFGEPGCLRRRHPRACPDRHPLDKLSGNLVAFHSIRVNRQWRLIFRWDGQRGEADGLYLDDHGHR